MPGRPACEIGPDRVALVYFDQAAGQEDADRHSARAGKAHQDEVADEILHLELDVRSLVPFMR
jgi:hypothetical protein